MAETGKYLIGESLREKLKSTISKVDSISFGGPVSRIPTALEGDSQGFSPKVFRVCTAAGAWPVDTAKTVTYYGVTSTPNTVSVINKIVSLPAPSSTNTSRIVNVAKDGTQWYLISFQMSSATAVFTRDTQTVTVIGTNGTSIISFVGTNSTYAISYASPGPEVSVVTNVSATLNTSDCSITVNKTTTSIKTVGSSQTASAVSVAGMQTATVISSTQTATITTGTYTATYIRLEL